MHPNGASIGWFIPWDKIRQKITLNKQIQEIGIHLSHQKKKTYYFPLYLLVV